MTNNVTPVDDRYHQHQSKAGKAGGRKRSAAKIAACRANLAKARQKRHNPVTGPQPILPSTNVTTS